MIIILDHKLWLFSAIFIQPSSTFKFFFFVPIVKNILNCYYDLTMYSFWELFLYEFLIFWVLSADQKFRRYIPKSFTTCFIPTVSDFTSFWQIYYCPSIYDLTLLKNNFILKSIWSIIDFWRLGKLLKIFTQQY